MASLGKVISVCAVVLLQYPMYLCAKALLSSKTTETLKALYRTLAYWFWDSVYSGYLLIALLAFLTITIYIVSCLVDRLAEKTKRIKKNRRKKRKKRRRRRREQRQEPQEAWANVNDEYDQAANHTVYEHEFRFEFADDVDDDRRVRVLEELIELVPEMMEDQVSYCDGLIEEYVKQYGCDSCSS